MSVSAMEKNKNKTSSFNNKQPRKYPHPQKDVWGLSPVFFVLEKDSSKVIFFFFIEKKAAYIIQCGTSNQKKINNYIYNLRDIIPRQY